ncbi:hypothetical protein ACEV8H_17965 [Vibrio parahaemolyticus]
MKKVTLTFVGEGSERIADKFYSWLADGGLEDSLIETLSDREVSVVGISDMDNETRDVRGQNQKNAIKQSPSLEGLCAFNSSSFVKWI